MHMIDLNCLVRQESCKRVKNMHARKQTGKAVIVCFVKSLERLQPACALAPGFMVTTVVEVFTCV